MKYFLLRTCTLNKIPRKINADRAIDIRNIHSNMAWKLPLWNLVEMESGTEMLYPAIIDKPFFMVSKQCFEIIKLYEPDTKYRCINLLCRRDNENMLYFLPLLRELDCLSEESVLNHNRSILRKPVLKEEIIRDSAVFRVAGFDESYVIGRLDFVESILRRKMKGISLTEVETRSGGNGQDGRNNNLS